MRIFLQDQGNQRIGRRRTMSTPHNTILQIDTDIAKKGRLESENQRS